MKKCPWMTINNERHGSVYIVVEDCMKGECEIWDEDENCCGLKLTKFMQLMANAMVK